MSDSDSAKVFGNESIRQKFHTASEVTTSGKNGGFEEKKIEDPKEKFTTEESPIEKVTLFDQLLENKKREEDELAERRKLMYGVRPMDDEEYKDYEQLVFARRERDRQEKDRISREEKMFQLMQRDSLNPNNDDDIELDNLTFGANPQELRQHSSLKNPLGLKLKVKTKGKKIEKKKKAVTKGVINLLSYGHEESN